MTLLRPDRAMVQTERHLLYAYCPRRQSYHGTPISCTMPKRPRAIALASRSAVRTVGVSSWEGIPCAIPARVAEGRHCNSLTSGEGMALPHCWDPCPRDPGVPPSEKHPSESFGARQRRAVLDSTPLLVPAMSRTRGTCLAVRCGRLWISRLRSWGHPLRCSWRKAGLVLVGHSRLKAVLNLD
jgi:hypothetical protein